MNIPDTAVEAALEVYARTHGTALDRLGQDDMDGLCVELDEILYAAAPFIAAQAIRDVINRPGMRVRQNTDYGYVAETVYSRDMLASRADELDQQ